MEDQFTLNKLNISYQLFTIENSDSCIQLEKLQEQRDEEKMCDF